jgi:hypothetical protein
LKLRPFSPLVVGTLAFWLGVGCLDPAAAQAPYNDATTAEGWAWSQIQQGDVADFNRHCGTEERPPDPKVDDSDGSISAARWPHTFYRTY